MGIVRTVDTVETIAKLKKEGILRTVDTVGTVAKLNKVGIVRTVDTVGTVAKLNKVGIVEINCRYRRNFWYNRKSQGTIGTE